MYKLKIFISSSVDEGGKDIFSPMRNKIKTEVEEFKLFDVYIYERGYGTTKNVIDDYLDEISDSHLCLFLINSAEGVPDGVQKEIKHARKFKKPQIYIFNHDNAEKETPLEKELKNPHGSRVKIIQSFEEFQNESVNSIKSEIVKIYKDYSSGRLVRFKEEESSTIDLNLSLTGTNLEKSYIKGFNKTKEYLCSFLGTEPRNFENIISNSLDEHTKSFFEVLIGKKNIREFNTTFYLDELKGWHRNEVFEVIEYRWRAIEYYYSGKLENCIDNLEASYEKAKENKVAPWLIQDILIDLRNKAAMKNSIQNKYEVVSTYQELLTESKEVLTYPVIDRLNKQLLERIENKRKDEFYKKPHSVTYDNILSEYAGMLTSVYVVAAHYGSLTHLELIIKNLQYIYFHLVESYSDWKFKVKLLKITAYLTNKKDMERILRKHNNIFCHINSKDVEDILSFSYNHPDEVTRRKNQLLTLSYLGYYLEDAVYDKYREKIGQEFKEWLNDTNKNITLGDFYFNFARENTERLNQNKLVQFANIIYSSPMARFNNGVLEVIKEIDFKMVEKSELAKLLKQINRKLKEEKLDRFDYLKIILIGINKSTGLKNETDEIAYNYLSRMERNIYVADTSDAQDSPHQMFLNAISSLEESNNEANLGTSYSISGYNYFFIIKLVVYRIKKLDEDDVNKLLNLLIAIVLHDNQDPDAKVNAFQLLIYLSNNDIRFSHMNSQYKKIVDNDHSV